MTARVRERQSGVRPRGYLFPAAETLAPLFPITVVFGAPTVPSGDDPSRCIEIPRPILAELVARDGAAGCADPVGEVAYLGVLQTDVIWGQIVFGELGDGDAAGPGASVGFGEAGEDGLAVHV